MMLNFYVAALGFGFKNYLKNTFNLMSLEIGNIFLRIWKIGKLGGEVYIWKNRKNPNYSK